MIKALVQSVMQKKSTKHIGAMSLQRLLQIILGFASSVIVIRYLGPEDYGRLSYVMAIMFILTPFFSSGVDDFLLKNLINNDGRDSLWCAFFIKFIYYVIVNIGVFTYYYFHKTEIAFVVLIYSLLMFFRTFDVFEVYMSSKSEFTRMSKVRAIVTVLLFGLKLFGVWMAYNWKYFVLLSAMEIVLVSIGFFLFYVKKAEHPFHYLNKVRKEKMNYYLTVSFPVLMVLIIDFSLMRIDQVMVEYFTDKTVLGIYSAGVKLIEVIKFIPVLFLTALMPEIVESFSQKKEETINKTVYLHGIQFAFGLVVLIYVLLLGKFTVGLLFGERFLGSSKVIQLYSVLMIITVYSNSRNKILIVKESYHSVLFFSIMVLAMNFGLNVFFIQKMGAVGAIYSSILSYIVSNLVFMYDDNFRKESLLPLKFLLKKK